jgi:hypothetical protein
MLNPMLPPHVSNPTNFKNELGYSLACVARDIVGCLGVRHDEIAAHVAFCLRLVRVGPARRLELGRAA